MLLVPSVHKPKFIMIAVALCATVVASMIYASQLMNHNVGSSDGSKSLFAAPIPASDITENSSLDDIAISFQQKTADLTSAKECFPLHMQQKQSVNLLYLYCSPEALQKDGTGLKISENFAVTDPLARRFNFWRRVYSLWSEDQYALHAADYPEVVLEVGDGSALWTGLSWSQKHKHLNRVLGAQREQYRNLLRKMHTLRKSEDRFTPAMRRVAALMAHIKDSDKYLKASLSLRLQRGQREQIAAGLSTATRYMAAIDLAFEQEGLPPELSKIAFIESSFNLKAHSKVGASGVYQIMPSTGREFMIVNDQIDERRDPIKAAHAAAKLLKQNYAMTTTWPLAITSYNHGAYGIRRATKAVGSKEIEKLIERYDGPAFGFASKNFYCGFLALLATVADAQSIFPEIPRLAPLAYKEVKLNKAMRISDIRSQYSITNDVLIDYNPDLYQNFVKQNGLLPRKYVVKVPNQQSVDPIMTTVSLEE